jgi:SAM-dependent methyltransferase
MYKCTFCGHGFLFPGVADERQLHGHYGRDYATAYSPEIRSKGFLLRKQQYAQDAALLTEHMPRKKHVSVLDYGCSTGQFLNAMPAHWKKSGFEVNQFELDYIRAQYKHIKVFPELSQLKKHAFDLVTMRGVIEHLFDFEQLFSVLKHSLKRGGIVYICATPDFSSPAAHVYRSTWNQIAPPLHYHQFTAASIAILFAAHNFGLKFITHPYLETPYAHFPKDAGLFVRNTKRVLRGARPRRTNHPYAGTMMSLLFEQM